MKPPPRLQALQEEFGQSIRTPFSFATGRFQCRREEYPESLAASILPRGASPGRDRLSTYNEQYWYRLLTVLQEDFPLLAASLGMWEFNRLATAYLDKHPSRTPYLHNVPEAFTAFIRGRPEPSQPRSLQIAELEMAFIKAFHAPSAPPLIPGELEPAERAALGETPLSFQPWFSLVREDWNLMECRTQLLEKKTEKPAFRDRIGYWAVFRTDDGGEGKELDAVQFRLLQELAAGFPIGHACGRTAAALDPEAQDALTSGISKWFSEWTSRKCFQKP